MKRRWFLTGLILPVVVAGCRALSNTGPVQEDRGLEAEEGTVTLEARGSRALVMATAADYPPYEQVADEARGVSSPEENGAEENGAEAGSSSDIVGFDIDLAQLIAARLERELTVVNMEFGSLIPAVTNNEVDMAMAALEPNRDRKQQVDFSYIYYRSRHALVSFEGLRSRDLSYQIIGVLDSSVQARYAAALENELPGLGIVPYPTTADVYTAIDTGEIDGAFVEAHVADSYLLRYPEFVVQLMPSEEPTGSAIALPKSSPLRSQINQAILDIKASGEMDRLISRWFG